jgi:hypothetical protein
LQNEYYNYDPNNPQFQRVICVAQKYDVIAINPTEQATLGEISLNDLLNDFCELFNANWHISGNELIFENVKYYINAFNYTPNTFSSVDVSAESRNKFKNKYQYVKDTNYHREVFTFNEARQIDFKGADIKYDSFFNSEKEIVKNRNVNNFTTELEYIKNFPNEIAKSGFVLAVVEFDTVNNTAKVVNYQGGITGELITNGLLCWATLHEKFFSNYRMSLNGYLNNLPVVFDSIRPNKTQENIIIDNCQMDFNSLNRVKTELGYGEIEDYTEDINTSEITMTLKHI